ncbi:unnamed protein product [Protopolystoma xenopodis]|uniref:Uncharacterized protein n=1 Tax=Protopolystoma xenopodis TaxID=117903 RepID=A0A3S5CRT5_9PLAT|nr:unnamed protein product [Protopolystoma xenopodis]
MLVDLADVTKPLARTNHFHKRRLPNQRLFTSPINSPTLSSDFSPNSPRPRLALVGVPLDLFVKPQLFAAKCPLEQYAEASILDDCSTGTA